MNAIGAQIMSDSIDQLAVALAKAQGEFKPVVKNKKASIPIKGGASKYEYEYGDLTAILDAVKGALSKYELAVSQLIAYGNEGPFLITQLTHSSGQWLRSFHELPSGMSTQAFGSAITYARRYALSPLLNIHAEDDDDGGAAHQETSAARPSGKPAPVAPISKPAAALPVKPVVATVKHSDRSYNDLKKAMAVKQWTMKDIAFYRDTVLGLSSLDGLDDEKYQDLCAHVSLHKPAEAEPDDFPNFETGANQPPVAEDR